MANRPHSKTPQIIEAFIDGKSVVEISDQLGVARQTVYNIVSRGRRQGVIPPKPEEPVDPKVLVRRIGLKVGKPGALFTELSPRQLDWLIGECVRLRMDTIMEYIIETIRDAHALDTSKRGKDQ